MPFGTSHKRPDSKNALRNDGGEERRGKMAKDAFNAEGKKSKVSSPGQKTPSYNLVANMSGMPHYYL